MNNLHSYTVSGRFFNKERRGLSMVGRAYQSIKDMLRYDTGTACIVRIDEDVAVWDISAASCTIRRGELVGYKVSKVIKARGKNKEWEEFCKDTREIHQSM